MRRSLHVSIALTALSLTQVTPSGADADRFVDDFRDVGTLRALDGVTQRRDFPRIVTRPDVRINATDPNTYKSGDRALGRGWFPAITRLHSGDLLCVYREGIEHGMARYEARAVVSRSTDGGRTWGKASVIAQREDWAVSPMQIIQLRDGGLLANLRALKVRRENKGRWEYSIVHSVDDGRSWSTVSRESGVPALEMSNGEMLWMVYARGPGAWMSVRGTKRSRFVDGKLTFTEPIPHPELGPTGDEWFVTETKSAGELVCMMRQQQHSHFYATAKSYDYGKTWTKWRDSNVYLGPCPTRPRIHTMPDGRLIFTHGQRWIGRTFAVVSNDRGETWDIRRRQTILHSPREYHQTWDSHYTDIARAEGDVWLGVDYIASPRHHNHRGVYGTFIDARYFRDAYRGLELGETSPAVLPRTVGYWGFDELGGEFARDPVNANFGEVHGAERVGGHFGGALDFDGEDDHVLIYDDATLRLPRSFTLEAWVKPRRANQEGVIISKAPAYTLALEGGRPLLQIGRGSAVAKLKKPLEPSRWYHIAVIFGMRGTYTRATFFVDGREISNMKMARGSRDHYADTYGEAALQTDAKIVGSDPRFQEYSHAKIRDEDCLVIGMANDRKSQPFHGSIDEVLIHRGLHQPGDTRASFARGRTAAGSVTSRPIRRPAGASWTTFDAKMVLPKGTEIRLNIRDCAGRVLKADAKPGDDLKGVNAPELVLSAKLRSSVRGQTPVLWGWSLGTDRGAPAILTRPFPDQTASLAEEPAVKTTSVRPSPPRKKVAPPKVDPGAVRLRPTAGIPLNLYRAPLGSKATIAFEIPYEPKLIAKAWLELTVDDIDEPKEATITLNGKKRLTVHESVLGEGASHRGALIIPVDALVKGRNTFEFVFVDNLEGTTEGYEILEATLALSGPFAKPVKQQPKKSPKEVLPL